MTPIVLSSTFAQESPGVHKGYEYSRSGNPTRRALETCLAALENGQYGFAFASGLGATATLLHTLSPGAHILCGDDVYGGTFRLMDKVMAPLGIASSFVDMRNPEAVRAAIRPETKMLWIETPTNPMLKVFDIAKLAKIADDANITFVVDNTFATPILQRPLDLGAHVVVHSMTKYLNGHSDVVGGAIITKSPARAERIGFLQNAIGAVPSPFDCYMVLRGLKTLHLRVRHQSSAALEIATRLEKHPDVERVYYPGLPSHPDYALAQTQMKHGGGMISVVLKGGLEKAKKTLENLNIFSCAESLGGVESLAEHPAIMTHASVPAENRKTLGISDGLIRLSIGVEAPEDLWSDLNHALGSR